MKLSYFNSIKSVSCQQHSISELRAIMNSPQVVQTCKGIREQMEMGNDEEARKFKGSLPVVCVSRLYDDGAPRKKGEGQPTGLIMMDYDNCKDVQEADKLSAIVKNKIVTEPFVDEHVVAIHRSPMHGIHIWFRWIDGCKSIAECQEKMAETLGMPDFDKACKDNSRCSFLVPYDYFYYLNEERINDNEHYAKLMAEQEKERYDKTTTKKSASSAQSGGHSDADAVGDAGKDAEMERQTDVSSCEQVSDVEISNGRKAFRILLEKAKLNNILDRENHDASGHTNHNVVLSLLSMGLARLVRKECLFKVLEVEMPISWSDDFARENLTELVNDFYKDYNNTSRPLSKEMRETFASINAADQESNAEEEEERMLEEMQTECLKELDNVEESIKKYVAVPKELPPIFNELVATVHTPWKPAAIVALLPMLGTICSKARGKYSVDGRMHSPTFMTVIEAPAASGKSQIMDFCNIIFERFDEENLQAETELNLYNAEVNKANGAKEIRIEMPDVCLRKVDGKFTEAGLDKVMNFYHGLHMWLGASEIDEIKENWQVFSYILRKVFDNDRWGRTNQSSKTFVGTRPLFLNILLLGTPRAVARCYSDPEDGLVHRTIFFKLMYDLPLAKRIPLIEAKKRKLISLCNRIHDKFSVAHDLDNESSKMMIAQECEFNMTAIDKWIEEWLKEKYEESVRTGQLSIDTFRRRAAVIGHRAGIICRAIYSVVNKDKPMTKAQLKVTKEFVLWVAEFTLQMAVYKFGENLDSILNDDMAIKVTKSNPILEQLPDAFTLAEAYKTYPKLKHASVRGMISRLLSLGLLENPSRGYYKKRPKDPPHPSL